MNHCLPSGCQEDEREYTERMEKEDRDQERRKTCASRSSERNRGSVEKELESEGESVSERGSTRWTKRSEWYMKFLNVENHLSAPIFSV